MVDQLLEYYFLKFNPATALGCCTNIHIENPILLTMGCAALIGLVFIVGLVAVSSLYNRKMN